MDRRRFVPRSEGLEGRQLLASSLFGSNVSVSSAADVPVTFEQKQLRIEHLPFYLEQLQPGRFLSESNIKSLQSNLNAIVLKLHKPSPVGLENFNTLVRDLMPNSSLSAQDANALNHAFGVIVQDAGATPEQVANLQADMNELARIDTQSRQPVYLATNDYSLVLQTILGVGRPIQRPGLPALAAKDGARSTTPGYAVSNVFRPSLVGTYGVGNTVGVFEGGVGGGFNSKGDIIQIVDGNKNVLGQTVVDPQNGNYRVTVDAPLPNGVYTLFVRAVDPYGNQSPLSAAYNVKVLSRKPFPAVTGQATPRGPLGI